MLPGPVTRLQDIAFIYLFIYLFPYREQFMVTPNLNFGCIPVINGFYACLTTLLVFFPASPCPFFLKRTEGAIY